MGFKDELKVFEHVVLNLQDLPGNEFITEEEVVKSFIVLNYIKYEKVPDVFLGCSALNLLNTYVEQKDAKIGYSFRRHLYNLLKGIDDINQIKTIEVCYDDNSGNGMLMISFWGFQFSFRGETKTETVEKLQRKNNMNWDGIKKQKCASSIFEFAINNKWLSNKTLNNASLKDLLNREMVDYKKGAYVFRNKELIKTFHIEHGSQIDNKYLKNYVRNELEKCKGRPVILTGKFKRVWDKHVTFTAIRPYIQGCHTFTICDHINIMRNDIERVMEISELEKNKKYYIIGFCEPYKNNERMGVKLAVDCDFCPIIKANEQYKISSDIFSICYRFSIEKYLRSNQKYLKM